MPLDLPPKSLKCHLAPKNGHFTIWMDPLLISFVPRFPFLWILNNQLPILVINSSFLHPLLSSLSLSRCLISFLFSLRALSPPLPSSASTEEIEHTSVATIIFFLERMLLYYPRQQRKAAGVKPLSRTIYAETPTQYVIS